MASPKGQSQKPYAVLFGKNRQTRRKNMQIQRHKAQGKEKLTLLLRKARPMPVIMKRWTFQTDPAYTLPYTILSAVGRNVKIISTKTQKYNVGITMMCDK